MGLVIRAAITAVIVYYGLVAASWILRNQGEVIEYREKLYRDFRAWKNSRSQ